MKKSGFSIPLIITMISLLVMGTIAFLKQQNPVASNDNKSKLTLLNTAQKIPVLKSLIQQNLAKQEELARQSAAQEAASENVLVKERVYTEQELSEMSEEKFVELLKDTTIRLPKLSDIKKIPPGVLHHTPAIILAAGRELGLIKEILKIHESYERAALPFYKSCAQNTEGTTPVRALCLTNLIEISRKNGQSIKTTGYPGNIVELAKMVTEI